MKLLKATGASVVLLLQAAGPAQAQFDPGDLLPGGPDIGGARVCVPSPPELPTMPEGVSVDFLDRISDFLRDIGHLDLEGLVEAGFGGCASEMTQWLNNLVLVEQMLNQLKMLAAGDYDGALDIARGLDRIKRLLRMTERARFEVEEAVAQYEELYPEAFPPLNREMYLLNREEQTKVMREAGLTSKGVTSGVMEKLDGMEGRLVDLSEASQSAEGQTSAIQAGTQGTLLLNEQLADLLRIQATHARVQEARLDAEASARARADAYVDQMWRDVPTWGGE